jgi:hypothetical protein
MSESSNDAGFSAEQRRLLASVLDEIVPASEKGPLPGAGEIGVAAYIEATFRKMPELGAMISQGLADLDAASRERHGRDFAALSRPEKLELLNQHGFVFALTLHAYTGYYQQPRVLAGLGVEARPPHPAGYEMEENDFSLLEPVRARKKMYRSV